MQTISAYYNLVDKHIKLHTTIYSKLQQKVYPLTSKHTRQVQEVQEIRFGSSNKFS